jgi:methionine-rich copper-binding protein CopC
MFLRLVTLPLLVSSLAFISPAAPDTAVMHLYLKSSAPQADAMVHELDRIELVFSESTQDGSVSARLLDAEGELVETPKAEPHGDEGVAFVVSLMDGIDPGAYTVSWRAMGSDGHVVRGDFGFVFMSNGDGVQATRK